MPELNVGDIRVAFDDFGPAEGGRTTPVLLLHGAVQTRAVWRAQVEALAATRRVVVPDLRGHGQTPLGADRLTIEQLATDAFALLDGLGIRRAAVCGVSLGGMIAIEMAVRAPDRVASLVLANTPTSLTSIGWLRRLVDRIDPQDLLPLAFRLLGPRRAARLGLAIASKTVGPHWVGRTARRHFIDGFGAMRPEAIVAAYRAIVEARPIDLAGIRCSTLLIEGADDAPSILSQMGEIADAIPQAQTRTVPAGHVAPLDEPGRFNRLLVGFLDERDDAAD